MSLNINVEYLAKSLFHISQIFRNFVSYEIPAVLTI